MERKRLTAAFISLFAGLLVMGIKYYAFKLTNSTAILSDALESVVNVVAAAFAIFAIRRAQEPPDSTHPYGHGKIEFVTAVFEGGLISFASIVIAYEAIRRLLSGGTTPILSNGLFLVIAAAALNGILGFYLLRTGKATHSMALEADGKHVLSDFATTLGILLALGIVKIVNLSWLDPAIALVMAGILAYTGVPLMKNAIAALLDAADFTLLEKILQSFEKNRSPEFIRAHHIRAMRNGRRIHVDGHLVIPEFWTVEQAHDNTLLFEQKIVKDIFLEGEIEFHIDPCRRMYCKSCEINACPIRKEAFVSRPPLSLEEMTSPVDITDRAR